MRQFAQTILRLNLETRAYHAEADAVWLDLVAPGRSIEREDYVETLTRVYGYESPLEAALAYTPQFELAIDLPRRFRSGLLAQDLLRLGIRPSQLSNVQQCMIAPFATVAEAMGWLYVHERFTLLHDAVFRQLQSRLIDDRDATSYLRAYEGTVGVRWDDLGLAIDRVARTPELEERMVRAATEAFRAAVDWYHVEQAQQVRRA